MNVTDLQFEQTLIEWFTKITGVLCIKSHQNAPRTGTGAYMTFNVIDEKDIVIPEVTYTDKDDATLTEGIKAWIEKTVSIQVYRQTDTMRAVDIVRLIKLQLESASATEFLAINGIGFVNTTKTLEMEPIREFNTEKRAMFNIIFNVNPELLLDVARVAAINIGASVPLSPGNVDYTNNNFIERS